RRHTRSKRDWSSDVCSSDLPYSHLCFFLVQLLSVVLAPIPSNVTALAGGVLFGTWPSFLMTFGAVALGSVLVFLLARGVGRDAEIGRASCREGVGVWGRGGE